MYENGQMEKIWSKWKLNVDKNCFKIKSEPVAFSNIISAFGLLFLSILASTLVLAIEFCIKKTIKQYGPISLGNQSMKKSFKCTKANCSDYGF